MSCVFLQKSARKIVRSAAGLFKVGAADHLVDGAVRLLNGRALQLAAQAGFDVGQILLPQRLLLGLFGLGQAGSLAFFCQRIDAGDLFLSHGEPPVFQRKICYNVSGIEAGFGPQFKKG